MEGGVILGFLEMHPIGVLADVLLNPDYSLEFDLPLIHHCYLNKIYWLLIKCHHPVDHRIH
jgi:hypothetical protein